MISDTFENRVVHREYTNNPVVAEIKTTDLHAWLTMMGQFRYNPIPPLIATPGPIGLLARKALLDENAEQDRLSTVQYQRETAETQNADGSWDSDVLKTAIMIIRLLEFDM